MPPKSGSDEIELKVRLPRELFQRVNDYRHEQKFDSRKEAVVKLLEAGLAGSRPTDGSRAEEA